MPFIPTKNDGKSEVALVRDVLEATTPNEFVFDCKGETVFRPRAVYQVFEGLTIERIRAGKMADDLPQQCAASQAGVAAMSGRLPLADRQFICDNYIPIRHGLRVAGALLSAQDFVDGVAHFSIAIPGEYEILDSKGPSTGLIDGVPYDSRCFLAQGAHDFRPAASAGRIAVVWSQAAEHRFTPFHRHARAIAPRVGSLYGAGAATLSAFVRPGEMPMPDDRVGVLKPTSIDG
jgi:hypothetical protein